MFCRFCGKQIHDEAYVCPACGGQVKAFPPSVSPAYPQAQPPAPADRKPALKRLCRVFGTLGIAFNAVAFGAFILQIISWILIVVCAMQETYAAAEPYLMLSVYCGSFAWIIGAITVGLGADFSIAAFVLSKIQKEDKHLNRRSTGAFIGAMILLVIWLFTFIVTMVYLVEAGKGV